MLRSFFVLTAMICTLSLSGCLTPLAPGAKSSAHLKLLHDRPNEFGVEHYEMDVNNKGDMATKGTMHWRGDGPAPAELDMNRDLALSSPGALAVAQGLGEAVVKLPDAIPDLLNLLGQISAVAPAGTPQAEAVAPLKNSIIQKIIRLGGAGLIP